MTPRMEPRMAGEKMHISGNKSGYAFILEMLFVTLFFSISAVVLLQGFTAIRAMGFWRRRAVWKQRAQKEKPENMNTGMTRIGDRWKAGTARPFGFRFMPKRKRETPPERFF